MQRGQLQALPGADESLTRPMNSSMLASTPRRVTVLFSGHVQGVGFRYTTHSIARHYRVTGYVRNLPDRRVELVAEGESREIEAFLSEVRERFFNHIREERLDQSPANGEFAGFEIRT
jgi:acylphosphatase